MTPADRQSTLFKPRSPKKHPNTDRTAGRGARTRLKAEHTSEEDDDSSWNVTPISQRGPWEPQAGIDQVMETFFTPVHTPRYDEIKASIDKETFLMDRSKLGPRHSQSCSNIPSDRQDLWEEEEEANPEELEKRHLNHQHHQRQCVHKLHCSHSKSEEGLLHANSSENALHLEHSLLYKSASLGRSLAFSDDTEILLDSGEPKKAVSPNQLPSKGILKNKQGQGGVAGAAGNIRKAKSLEVLSTRVERTTEGPKGGKDWVGKSKLEDENMEKKKEAVRQSFVQEKLQFSAFLNEITRRVISPSCLSSLGVTGTCQSPGQVDSPKHPRKGQRAEGKGHEEGKKHRQQKDRSGTPDSVASSVHSHASKYPDSSKHHHHHRHSIDTRTTILEFLDKNRIPKIRTWSRPPAPVQSIVAGTNRHITGLLQYHTRFLQEQNEELRHSLLQAVVRMECMEADLQNTQVELNSVKDSFKRLQENSSSTQQTNQLLEQKLQAMAQSTDAERKRLTQRISELSRELTAAQTSILSPKTIHERRGGRGARGHWLSSPIHVLFSSSEESQPSSTQQQCHQDPNPDEHDPAAVTCTSGPLKSLPAEGGAPRDSDEDEIVHNWRIRNNSNRKTGAGGTSSENNSGVVTYRSAQRMLDSFMRHLHPPEEKSEGKGGDTSRSSGPKEEGLNGERKQL
ncbi:hypothetical protein AAFF_G00321650 [Aldrovandia affinis]|uniref:Uncharacterized protein n=1 Tax=Aldrovandia affinis TaxID=143900 RepID=A0AAD7SM30_9TELE|nr:hypothetical protein AAFF_G00321650 [Aldrovandia affinis]